MNFNFGKGIFISNCTPVDNNIPSNDDRQKWWRRILSRIVVLFVLSSLCFVNCVVLTFGFQYIPSDNRFNVSIVQLNYETQTDQLLPIINVSHQDEDTQPLLNPYDLPALRSHMKLHNTAPTKQNNELVRGIIERSKQRTSSLRKNLTAILHVGPMKTGSSSIQRLLLRLKDQLLDDDNYEFAHNCYNYSVVQMRMCFHKTKKNLCHPPLLQQIHDIALERNHNVIISDETIHDVDKDLSLLREYLTGAGWDTIIIVVFYRRYYDWLESYHNQIMRNQKVPHRISIVRYIEAERQLDVQRSENTRAGKWGHHYTISAVNRMREHFNTSKHTIRLFHMNQLPQEDVRHALPCNILGQTSNSCKALKLIQRRERKQNIFKMTNQHRDMIYEDLTYYALQMGLWKERSNLTRRRVRALVRHEHEKVQNKTGLDFTIGKTCPDQETYDWLLNATLEAEEILFPKYYHSQGRSEILRDFSNNQHKLCAIDAQSILQPNRLTTTTTTNNTPSETDRWRKFFATL